MKAAWYEKNGSARDVLRIGECEKPVAGPGQVLVRVYVVGVNPSDTKARSSVPLPPGVKRLVPHQDGAGVVEAVGEGVSPTRLGERVWIYEALYSGGTGCAAEYVAVPSANAVLLPNGVSFEVGACLGVPALTAHRCVFADGPVTGLRVLVTGGAGSVGAHAIQFAKSGGASVFTTVGSQRQSEVAADAGAALIIDRHNDDQIQKMQEAAGSASERSVDRIVEVAFGINLSTTMRVLKENGVVATYSSDADPEPKLTFFPLLRLGATVRFIFVYSMSTESHHQAIKATNQGLREGWLKPTIAARFSLDKIADAHELSESGKIVGKALLLID